MTSPDETDDGVPYLDTSRLITSPPDVTFFVPLVREDGTKTGTIVREDEACILARHFGFQFDCPVYRAAETTRPSGSAPRSRGRWIGPSESLLSATRGASR